MLHMTGTQAKPTINRRRVGSLLRQYREAHVPKILSKAAARHLDVEPSVIGRIERGEYRIKPHQIQALLQLYEIDDREVFVEMKRVAAEPIDAGWWYPYRHHLKKHLADFITLESEATEILSVAPAGVYGLLQCSAYAREVQETAPVIANRDLSDLFVSVRLARQQAIMRSRNPAQLRCIMAEASFHSDSVSVPDQIQHLLSISKRDNVTIQVMPLSAPVGMHIDVQSTLLRFRHPWPDVSYEVGLSGGILDDSPEGSRTAHKTFTELAKVALSVDRTREFLENRLESIKNA